MKYTVNFLIKRKIGVEIDADTKDKAKKEAQRYLTDILLFINSPLPDSIEWITDEIEFDTIIGGRM